MTALATHKQEIFENGFSIIKNIYSETEVETIINTIQRADDSNPSFRKSTDVFAIRQFLKEVPQVLPFIFNKRLKDVISNIFGDDYFVVKSIYFDKPGESNWFVSYHQT